MYRTEQRRTQRLIETDAGIKYLDRSHPSVPIVPTGDAPKLSGAYYEGTDIFNPAQHPEPFLSPDAKPQPLYEPLNGNRGVTGGVLEQLGGMVSRPSKSVPTIPATVMAQQIKMPGRHKFYP